MIEVSKTKTYRVFPDYGPIVTGVWGEIGGSPFVKVKCAGKGIDWDKSKFQIFPEINLEESLDNEEF